MKYHIVVSKYKEDIEWTKSFDPCNITIYNKSDTLVEGTIQRPNIGREAETFFYHIIKHYDQLPDYLIVLQGNPFDHTKEVTSENIKSKIDWLLEQLNNEQTSDAIPFFKKPLLEPHYPKPGLRVPDYYYKLFEGDIPDRFEFSSGCQYFLSRDTIRNRSLNFYKKIYNMIINNKVTTFNQAHYGKRNVFNDTIDGWVLERLFPYIFDMNIKINSQFM
jgi:hypothetical protein